MPKQWNQCTECDRFIPCRQHPDAGFVGPVPDDEGFGDPPPWAALDTSKVTRFEVIDGEGRSLAGYVSDVRLELQDHGLTLKVFVDWINEADSPEEKAHRKAFQRDLRRIARRRQPGWTAD